MFSEKIQKIIKSLEAGTFRKIICGASNTSEKQVERLSLIYSLAGVDVIDTAPHENIHDAAKRGINKALAIAEKEPNIYPEFNIPAVMTSINVGDDKHFRKAVIDVTKCLQCLECAKSCQSAALTQDSGTLNYDSEKCYGCAKCLEACQHNVIKMTAIPNIFKKTPSKLLKTDAIEIHTGNSSVEKIKTFLDMNKMIVDNAGIVSVSVESSRFNNSEFVKYVNSITKMFNKKIIVQADGLSMGGGGKPTSTIQSIAAATILLDAKINAYIQIAGGTNHLTAEIVNLTRLKISGIGYGTFAKKIILNYIEEYSEAKFIANLAEIVKITANLIKI